MRPIDRALRRAREQGNNQSQFATQIGVSPQDITNWKARGMPPEWHARVAKVLHYTVEELLGEIPEVKPFYSAKHPPAQEEDDLEFIGRGRQTFRIPVVGTAKMGEDGFYDEISSMPGAGDGHVEIATEDINAYCLRVRGQSMFPAIRDGWYVLIEPNGTPSEGEYVLIRLRDGRKMVKEFMYRRVGTIELMSVNGQERISVDLADLDEERGIQAVGAVVPPSKWRPE